METQKFKRYLTELTYVRLIGIFVLILTTTFEMLPLLVSSYFIFALLFANLITYLKLHLTRNNHLGFNSFHFILFLIYDSLTLFFLMKLTGGAHNPFAYLFLVQMAFSAKLLSTRASWFFAFYLITLYALLFITDKHLHHNMSHDSRFFTHLLGMLISFSLLCFFLVHFIGKNLQKVRALERQEKEKETLIIVGAFAAQAAHQMGTPLNSLALLSDRLTTKDNKFYPEFKLQIKRCKKILDQLRDKTSMLQNTAFKQITMNQWIEEVTEKWAKNHFPVQLKLDPLGSNEIIEVDTAWEYAIFNLLDNAYESGAQTLQVSTKIDHKECVVEIRDDGPGLPDDIIESDHFHHGLGLYLTHTTLTQKGGKLKLSNHEKGAVVQARWKRK